MRLGKLPGKEMNWLPERVGALIRCDFYWQKG